jgi:uncharacterized cupredoxin-like copper-binding protein
VVTAASAIALFAAGCSNSGSSDITAAPAGGSSATPSTSSGATGSTARTSAATATTVGATEKDFAITLDKSSAAAGNVTFHVTNDGPATHQFLVLKTDDAPDALPTDSEGNADTTAKGVNDVGQIESINAGSSQDLSVELQPGKYVVICNLPGHYKLGMHAGLTVS